MVNSTDRLQFREALRWSPGWWEDRSRAYRGGWCKRPTIGLATTIRTSIASARLWRYADNGCGHRFSCHCRLRRWSVSGLAGSPSSSGAKGTPNNLLFHELWVSKSSIHKERWSSGFGVFEVPLTRSTLMQISDMKCRRVRQRRRGNPFTAASRTILITTQIGDRRADGELSTVRYGRRDRRNRTSFTMSRWRRDQTSTPKRTISSADMITPVRLSSIAPCSNNNEARGSVKGKSQVLLLIRTSQHVMPRCLICSNHRQRYDYGSYCRTSYEKSYPQTKKC